MPPVFNPYRVKLGVSTGSKGRRRFDAGRIKLLKNEWKSMGLHLVPPQQADYIVVPDGSHDTGQSGRFATPIHYSDFIELLSRHQRPVLPLTGVARLRHSQNSMPDTSEPRLVRHEMAYLERRLKDLSDRPTVSLPYQRLPPRLTLDPPAARVLTPLAQTDPDVWRYEFVPPTVDFAVVNKTVEKLRSVTNLQNFITSAVNRTARMYPTLYTDKQKSLEELRRLTLVVLTFWQELRINLQVIMPADLRPRLDLNALPLCEVPPSLGLPYDLTSSWTHFFSVWSTNNSLLFTREDLIGAVTDRRRAADYFWTIETNLYINYAAIQCAQHNLQLQFVDWVKVTRERFRTTPRCSPGEQGQCPGQFCIFYDQQCHEKPVLFVLDELVIAFCGSSELLPITREDYVTVNRLHGLIKELYQRWFKREPLDLSTRAGVCEQILIMVQIMMVTIKEEMQVDSLQDLLWSDLPELMSPETLLRDWDDPATTKTALRETVFSDAYLRRVKEVGQSLLRL